MAVENKYKISVNLKNKMPTVIPQITANDNVVFDIDVLDGPTAIQLSSNYVYLLVSKARGRDAVIREGQLINGLIQFKLGSSEMLSPGTVEATVQILNEQNKRVSTARFDYNVISDISLQGSLPADDKTLVIANQSLLETAINDSEAAISNATTAIAKSTTALETAEQVRGEFDSVVAEAGSNNPEVVQARGGEINLNIRLNKVNERLAVKANQSDLSTTQKVQNKTYYNKNGGRAKRWNPPSWFTPSLPINIFKKGKKFFTDFDVSEFKNAGGTTYYVSPNGSNTNNGLSEASPFLSFNKAYNTTSSGDTICLLDGLYGNELFAFNANKVQKSLNIVAKNNGKVIFSSGNDNLTYTKTTDATNVYQAARSSVERVVYIFNGEFVELTKVSSIAECDTLKGSYYLDSNNVYIHTFDDTLPDNKVYHSLVWRKMFHFEPLDSDMNIYMEGITVIGGIPNITVKNTANNNINFYAKDVKSLFNGSSGVSIDGKNAFNIIGASYCFTQNCEGAMAFWDGFNYHAQHGVATKYIEFNNIAYENGNLDNSDSYQGSTSHDGCNGIRLNCSYFNNIGQNIADVGNGTLSLILGCETYGSKAQSNDWGVRTNINTKSSGPILHVEGCYMFDSTWDIIATSNSTIYIADDNVYSEARESGGGSRPHITSQ